MGEKRRRAHAAAAPRAENHRPGPLSEAGEQALRAASSGWSVFPVDGLGEPLVTNWRRAATTDEKQIASWWSVWSDAQIGVSLVRSNAAVLIGRGAAGSDALRMLLDRGGIVPTVWWITADGSTHVLVDASAIPRGLRTPARGRGIEIVVDRFVLPVLRPADELMGDRAPAPAYDLAAMTAAGTA